MKTLVIGGTGLLGMALVHQLVMRNKEVKATVRQNSPPRAIEMLQSWGIETVYADIRDRESIEKALDQVEDVYLSAALFKTWLPDTQEFKQTNTEGVRIVLDLCLKKRIQKVVYTSSHATIGLRKYPEYADEATPILKHQFSISPYVQSKYQAEQIARQYYSQGLNIVIVNPVGMIGINDFSNNPTNKYIRLAAEGKIPGFYIDSYTCLVDSQDAAVGHILAMEKGRPGERYILGGENITFREYFTYLGQLADKEIRPIAIPLWLLLPISYLLEWKAALANTSPELTSGSVKFLMPRTRYSSKKAQEELGYHFRPIKESIRETYHWFKADE